MLIAVHVIHPKIVSKTSKYCQYTFLLIPNMLISHNDYAWYALCYIIIRYYHLIGYRGLAMCTKFQYYSSALGFAHSMKIPVVIILGQDSFYWVMEKQLEAMYVQKGRSILYTGMC